jgi:N-acetylmuramoyl-L-alanine amidase
MRERDRRRLLKSAPGVLLAVTLPGVHGATLIGVRVWPSPDYTRVTLELDAPLPATHFTTSDPPRVVVDFEGIDLTAALRELVARVRADDPYIAGVRIGQNRPGVARLVLDLKHAVDAQVFALTPVGDYRHRMVIDLYPLLPPDPIAELIAQNAQNVQNARNASAAQAARTARPTVGTRPGAPSAATSASPSTAAPAPSAYPDPIDPLAQWLRERTPAPVGASSAARAENGPSLGVDRVITIAIDPGHGGEDPGAIGPGGTMEKEVVLAIARRLRDRLAAESTWRVLMTRDGDFFVPLATRVRKAAAVSADLFISIHADAFTSPEARGSSVFVLSERGASSVGARWLANQENRADQIGGVNISGVNVRVTDRDVSGVLIDLTTAAQIRHSRRLGTAVLNELGRLGPVHKPSVEQAAFAVLKAPDIPSLLVETAFISHPQEEEKLRDPLFQDQVAQALHAGIRHYFRAHPPGPRGAPA